MERITAEQDQQIEEEDFFNIETTRENRRFEIIRKRHEAALAFTEVEEKLHREINDALQSFPINTKVIEQIKKESLALLAPIFVDLEKNKIGLAKKEAAVKAINLYVAQCTEARVTEENYKRRFDKKEIPFTPQKLGEYLFLRRTGLKPDGKIFAARNEGYFIIVCYNARDYAVLNADYPVDKPKPDSSVGVQYTSFKLRDNNSTISCITMKATPDVMDEFADTLLHEQQHFFNEVIFNYFSSFEQTYAHDALHYPTLYLDPSQEEEQACMQQDVRKVKDELVARLREVSANSSFCTNFVDNKMYKDITENLSSEERKDLSNLMTHIKWELDELFELIEGPKQRSLLVYHLIDIPLIRFPEWLRALRTYYSKSPDSLPH